MKVKDREFKPFITEAELQDIVARLAGEVSRDYGDGETLTLTAFDSREIELDEPPDAFRIRKGYPEQMRFSQLREQIERRQNVGLVTERYELAMHNKFASPLSGLPGLFLIFALTVRPSRRGRMSSTLAEGFVRSWLWVSWTILMDMTTASFGIGHRRIFRPELSLLYQISFDLSIIAAARL